MTLLDAYALIALVAGGSAGAEVRALIRAGGCAVATVNLAEVFDVLERVRAVPPDRARAAIEPLLDGLVETIALTAEIARSAGELRATHHHRTEQPLSLADCVLLASGAPGDRIATADPDVLGVAVAIGLEPLELAAAG